jgi:hypothetical protein
MDDGNKIYIELNQELSTLKSGIVTYIIKGQISNKIKSQKNKKFYLIDKDITGMETVVYWGKIE